MGFGKAICRLVGVVAGVSVALLLVLPAFMTPTDLYYSFAMIFGSEDVTSTCGVLRIYEEMKIEDLPIQSPPKQCRDLLEFSNKNTTKQHLKTSYTCPFAPSSTETETEGEIAQKSPLILYDGEIDSGNLHFPPVRNYIVAPDGVIPSGSKQRFQVKLDRYINDREAYWYEACSFKKMDSIDLFGNGARTIAADPNADPENWPILYIRKLMIGNIWHDLLDSPILWCIYHYGNTHFGQNSGPPWNFTVVLMDVIDNFQMKHELIKGLAKNLISGPEDRRFLEMDGKHWIDKLIEPDYTTRIAWTKRYLREYFFHAQINERGMPGPKTNMIALNRKQDSFQINTIQNALRGKGIDFRKCDEGHVLLLDRMGSLNANSRKLVDVVTGDLNGVIGSLCAKSLPLKITDLNQIPYREQLKLFSKTAVLIGVHGAGLTNLMFMRPGSAVVEINIRMRGKEEFYGPVVYVDAARAFDMWYFSFDQHHPKVASASDPHKVTAVYVNSSALASVVSLAYCEATSCTSPPVLLDCGHGY